MMLNSNPLINSMRIRPPARQNRRKPPNISTQIPIKLCICIPRHQTRCQDRVLSKNTLNGIGQDFPGIAVFGGHGRGIEGIVAVGEGDCCVAWVGLRAGGVDCVFEGD